MRPISRGRQRFVRHPLFDPLEDRRLLAASFGAPTTVASGSIDQVAIGDLRHNGRDDLVYDQTGGNAGVYVALSNPDGSFGTPYMVAPSGQFVLADFNGDGNLDLAVNASNQGPVVVPGLGNGQFQAVAFPQVVNPSITVTLDGSGDFDGDGRTDLLYTTVDTSVGIYPKATDTVALSRGNGQFVTQDIANYRNGYEQTPIIGDFNGDGKADIAEAYSATDLGTFSFYQLGTIQYNWGDGTFTDPFPADPGDSDNPSILIVPGAKADFNGDGKLDFVSLQSGRGGGSGPIPPTIGGPGSVSLNFGDGTFKAPVPLPGAGTIDLNHGSTPSVDTRAVAGDFDGDGKNDLIVVERAATEGGMPTYQFLGGNGDGTFRNPVFLGPETSATGVGTLAVGDFNGDGKPDLVSLSNLYNVEVAVYPEPPLPPSVLNVLLNTTPPVSGALDPASDTGISNNDNVTSDTTPTFEGKTIPGQVVTLLAQFQGASSPLGVGSTTAGADGSWRITTTPLIDGIYTISASVTTAGVTASAVLAGGNTALVVNTAPPTVVGASVSPLNGQVRVTIHAGVAGFYTSTLTDPSEFVLTNVRGQVIPIAGIRVSPSSPIAGDVQLVATVAGGRLRSGVYTLRLRSSSIQDRAGNSLAGAFTQALPSGDGHAGTDFVGRFGVLGRYASSVLPLVLPRGRFRR